MDRIAAIQKSLTAFVCGIVGFLPIIGLLPALYALRNWQRVRSHYGKQWNPAADYLNGGAVFALAGLLGSGLLLCVIAFVISTSG